MEPEIEKVRRLAQEKITSANTSAELSHIEKKLLHKKKGLVPLLFARLAKTPQAERKKFGKKLNQLKAEISRTLESKKESLTQKESLRESFFLDVTLPPEIGLKKSPDRLALYLIEGRLHAISQTIREIADIFQRLGFIRRRYQEVDEEYYAFDGLNIPPKHPARNELETFFVENNLVLTPHTSNGQLHEMERGELPIRMINISRCARRQEDLTHIPTFYQFEGLLVDQHTSIAELIGTISYFIKNYFGEERSIRLRPHNFRFTEPSFEVDVSCGVCHGRGCKTCKGGWLELAGAGMVHPAVLKAGGVNPSEYKGFAFGFGVERVFMMKNPKSALPDIRVLYQNDLRLLKQF